MRSGKQGLSVYPPTRRGFCKTAAAAWMLHGTGARSQSRSQTHPDVAAIDHDRILSAADRCLKLPVVPLTSLVCKRSPGTSHDFYSEPEDFFPDAASATATWVRRPDGINPDAFDGHRDAVYQLGVSVAALTAGAVVSGEARYAAKAAEHLRTWFVAPETRMTASLQLAQRIPGTPTGRFEGVIETVPLAEVARSIRFLATFDVLSVAEVRALRGWFGEYSAWLSESRMAGLARDQKDHHAASWLFQCCAYADANVEGLTSDDANLNTLRHRFKTVTLRALINATGNFPRDVATATPYRNSLLTLDLLTLACELLTTRFDNPWEFELQDGPGMRAAIAYHYPFIANRAAWPYPADLTHFKELPGRRISLLLTGRAYGKQEYVELWRSLSPLPEAAAPELCRSFPVSQPLLWATRQRARRIEAE